MGDDGHVSQKWKSPWKSLQMAEALSRKWAAWRDELDTCTESDDKSETKLRGLEFILR